MWRAFFLGVGITCVIMGAECTVVDKVLLASKAGAAPAAATGLDTALNTEPKKVKEVAVPDWAPWSLMAGGAVVILYSFTIPRRVNSG
jgi:hypothetical protein